MNYCTECGEKLRPSDSYCPSCGIKIDRYQDTEGPTTPNLNTTRRDYALGAGLVGTLIAGGVGVLWWLNDSPSDVAEDFIVEVVNGNFSEANELIHPDARIDGAGHVLDLLGATTGVDRLLNEANIDVTESNTVREEDTEAVVDVSIHIDIGFDETSGAVRVNLRESDGDWMVYNVNV